MCRLRRRRRSKRTSFNLSSKTYHPACLSFWKLLKTMPRTWSRRKNELKLKRMNVILPNIITKALTKSLKVGDPRSANQKQKRTRKLISYCMVMITSVSITPLITYHSRSRCAGLARWSHTNLTHLNG